MFKSYFSDTEMQELDSLKENLEKKLDGISQEIKDMERTFKQYHFTNNMFNYNNFSLIYANGRIYFKEDGKDTRLLECKKEIRLKVANYLPVFARDMCQAHKARLKGEGF